MKLIIAHRGRVEEDPTPENTPEAFENAIAAGAGGNELDLRRTFWRYELVAWHDPTVDGVPVRQLTRVEMYHRRGMLPAALEDVLAVANARDSWWDFELKDPEPEVAQDVLARIDAWALPRDRFIITSFHDEVVACVKEIEPSVRTGLILGRPRADLPDRLAERLKIRASELFPAPRLRECGADYVVPSMELVRFGVLTRSRRWPALVWNVNADHDIRRMLAHPQVEGLITYRPRRAVALAAERPAA